MTATPDHTTLTRKELYDLIWSTPMSRLAKRFGISDVGLAKICRRQKIPRPARGHWAKLEAGKNVRRTPLFQAKGQHLQAVVIARTPDLIEAEYFLPDTRERLEAEQLPESKIEVLEQIGRRQPLVKATFEELRRRQGKDDGRISPWGEVLNVFVSPASLDRAERILSALVKALKARSIEVTVEEHLDHHRTVAVIGGQPVAFRLWEPLQQVRAEPSDDPLSTRKYDLAPTAVLCLEISDYLPGRRRSWRATGRTPLERWLNRFVIGLILAADDLARRRAEIEQRRREDAERERIRREAEARRREEQERLDQLLADADAWHRSQLLREFMVAVMAVYDRLPPEEQTEGLQRYLAWANEQAVRMDPLINPRN